MIGSDVRNGRDLGAHSALILLGRCILRNGRPRPIEEGVLA